MAVTNEQIGKLMNTVRGVASSVYQNTVPEYTIDDVINNYGNLITSNSVIRNEFISILQNVIFYEYFAQHTFENKFSRLKKPVDVARASTFELFANPINPLQYDGTALDRILNIYKRDVKKQIYTRNREDVFPISITAVELESAFQSNEAFYTFVSQKWRSIQDSNEIVEYNAIKELINVNVTSGALKTLDVTGMTSEQKLKAVKKIMYGMESPSADYNNYKAISGDSGDPVTTSTPFRSMLMVLGGDLKTDIDVDVLAGVFNLDKATLAENSITVDNFNYNEYDRENQTIKENHKSNIVGLICDENLFKFTEQLNTSAGMMNPATLTEQTFVHIWQTIAIRAWANCVVLIDNGEEPTPPVEESFQLVSDLQGGVEVVDGFFSLDYIGTPPSDENLTASIFVFQEGISVDTAEILYDISFDEENKKVVFTIHSGITYDGTLKGDSLGNVILTKGEGEVVDVAFTTFTGIPVNYSTKLNSATVTVNVADVTQATEIDLSSAILPQNVSPPASLAEYASSVYITCSDNTVVPTLDLTQSNIMTIPANSLTAGETYDVYVTINRVTKLYTIDVAGE